MSLSHLSLLLLSFRRTRARVWIRGTHHPIIAHTQTEFIVSRTRGDREEEEEQQQAVRNPEDKEAA